MIIGYTKRKCVVKGCKQLGRNKGRYKGIVRYDAYCPFHHLQRLGKASGSAEYLRSRYLIKNDRCENCGWNKAYCDRHRIEKEKGYTRENVIVLCPNCHRLATLNLLKTTS